MKMFRLTLALLGLTACLFSFSNAATAQEDAGPGQPLGLCCSPAQIGTAPSSVGCGEECPGVSLSDPGCAGVGSQSGVFVWDGSCEVAEPGMVCTIAKKSATVANFACRKKTCGAGKYQCYWENIGTTSVSYDDCSGDGCW